MQKLEKIFFLKLMKYEQSKSKYVDINIVGYYEYIYFLEQHEDIVMHKLSGSLNCTKDRKT